MTLRPTSIEIPTLETERLILRAPRASDFDAYAAFMASPRAEYVGGPMDRSAAWSEFASFFGCWAMHGFGPFAVEEKATGAFVGDVGPWFPVPWPEPEMAWDLLEGFEGRGYATEAARAARDWAYRARGWTTAISLIAAGNAPSQGVATRLGCRPAGEVFTHPYKGWQAEIWRHPSAAELAA